MGSIIYNNKGKGSTVDFLIEFVVEKDVLFPTSKSSDFAGSTVTVTANDGYTISSRTIKGGEKSGSKHLEQIIYSISGTATYNRIATIGSVKVEANDSSISLTRAPYLKTNSPENFKLLPRTTERYDSTDTLSIKNASKNNKSWTLDIVYRNKKSINRTDFIIGYLKFRQDAIRTRSNYIENITFGPDQLLSQGEVRTIKIFGDPGTAFGLAVNKNSISTELEEDGSTPTGRVIFNTGEDTSILGKKANSTTTSNYGVSIPIIKGTIPSGGVYSFNQSFSFPRAAKLSSTISSTATVPLDDVSLVQVGDTVTGSPISIGTVRTVSSINTAAKTIALSGAISATSGDTLVFKARESYSIDVIQDECGSINSDIIPINNSPTYTLNKYINPIITFKATASSSYTITHFAYRKSKNINTISPPESNRIFKHITDPFTWVNAATSFSAGDDHSYYATGPANRKSIIPINIEYTIVAASGRFTVARNPIWNNLIESDGTAIAASVSYNEGSDWTNSDWRTNGGTRFFSTGATATISTGSGTDDTVKIRLQGFIRQIGIQDVTFDLDIDKLVTIV